ncbi:MAG: VanZ family protein [Vicinamibacterales bacterium]
MAGLLSRERLALWLPAVAYMAFIFALSSVSTPPELPAGADKKLHAVLYAGLGALLARALAGGTRRVTGATIVLATIVGTAYGVSDEFHQYFNPPRSVELLDVVADAIGSALGAGTAYAWGIIRARDGV